VVEDHPIEQEDDAEKNTERNRIKIHSPINENLIQMVTQRFYFLQPITELDET
jgi:hypothetical protein